MKKKKEILIAASVVFQKYGYGKTTLEDIAKECGMKNTALYYYFKNKEDILNAMFDRDMKEIQNNIRSVVAKENTPQKKIHAFILQKLILFKTQRKYFNLVLREDLSLRHRQFAFEQKRKFDEFEKELLTEILSEGIKSGIFENHPLDSLIYMITGIAWGISYFVLQNEEDINLLDIVDNIVLIIFRGLEKNG